VVLQRSVVSAQSVRERVDLDLAAELAKGQRVVEMGKLFSSDTVDAGQAASGQFETSFALAKAAAAVAVLGLAAGSVVLVVLALRRRRMREARREGATDP
jgi:hypothetical protein